MLGAIEENKIGVHDSKYLRSSGGWGVEERGERVSQADSKLGMVLVPRLNPLIPRSLPEPKPRIRPSTD